MDGLLTGLQRVLYGDEAVEAARHRRMAPQMAQEQFQQLLGQKPVEYQPGISEAPVLPQAGTGLLGGHMDMKEFATRLLGVPGYQQSAVQLLGQMRPTGAQTKPQLVETFDEQGRRVKGWVTPGQSEMIQIGAAGPGEDVKMIGKDAAMWMNQQGQPADPTMSVQQATSAGFRPVTTEQAKGIEAVKSFAPALTQAIRYGFGADGGESLFPKEAGVFSRPKAFFEEMQAGMGYEPQLAMYRASQDALVSNLARIAGQTGVLTDRDVERVVNLMPKPHVTTESEAEERFRSIAGLLKAKGMSESQMLQAGLPEWAVNGGTRNAVLRGAPIAPPSIGPGTKVAGGNRRPQDILPQVKKPWEIEY